MQTLPSDFEPNKASKHQWFGTRKKSIAFGTVELPGFFQTHEYSSDTIKMCIILILELVGAFAIMYEGEFVFLSVIPVLFAIFIDIFLAIKLHSYVPMRLENKNQAKATDDPRLANRYEELSKKGSFAEILIKISIYILGAMKGFGYLIFVGEIQPQVVLMFLVFLIIASLHISTTGYWVAASNLGYSIKKQIKNNIDTLGQSNKAITRTSTFHSDQPIELVNIGSHSLTKGINAAEYKLTTVGILMDNELAAMVAIQPSINLQSVIATVCIKHQIQNILLG